MLDWPRLLELAVFGADWSFVPAGPVDCSQWSTGTVRKVEDLYSPKIFGPAKSFRCDCGKYAGEDMVGRLCPGCGTIMTDDAEAARGRRMGKIDLACYCDHPLKGPVPPPRFPEGAGSLFCFPVCPLGYRTGTTGRPNPLGLKYERLVEVNVRTAAALPPRDHPDFVAASLDYDTSELLEAMRGVIGVGSTTAQAGVDGDSLLPLLCRALLSCDPEVAPLARSCLLTVRLQARI